MSHLVLLTGLMGTGKSTVAQMLKEKGFIVLDTDTLMKSLYTVKPVKQLVNALFGPRAFIEWPEQVPDVEKRRVDLEFIKGVFFDKGYINESTRLEFDMMQMFYRMFRLHDDTHPNDIIFVEAAPTRLIYDFIQHYKIKQAVNVVCDENIRIARLLNRGMRMKDIELRKTRQKPFMITDCYTVINNGDEKELSAAVSNLVEQVKQDYNIV